MDALTPGLVAEIACGAGDWDEFERQTTCLLLEAIGADAAFYADADGIGRHGAGVIVEVCDSVRSHWRELAVGAEPLLRAAAGAGGTVVDAELLGAQLERVPYYELMMRPVQGRATLIGVLVRGGEIVQKVALGRCRGSSPFTERHHRLLRSVLPTITLAHGALRARAASAVDAAPQAELAGLFDALTPREREVLEFLHLGYTNAQIGAALGTRAKTVRNQLSRVYAKLGVANRSEAVGVALALHGSRTVP